MHVDNPRVGARLKQAGAAVGIDFTGACDVRPNTLRAHALLDLAMKVSPQVQNAVAEKLFHAYFTAGDDVSDVGNLTRWARECGMDDTQVQASLTGPHSRALFEHVMQEASQVRHRASRNFSGVPYFSFNGNHASGFSGAVPAAQLVRIIRALRV